MMTTDTLISHVDLRLGERRPTYCVVMLLQALQGGFIVQLHEGTVGLDGKPCYHTGRYDGQAESVHTEASAARAAYEDAVRFRRSIGWADAPRESRISFTADAPKSDATTHLQFRLNIGVKQQTAARYLTTHHASPEAAQLAERLERVDGTIGQWPVLRNSAMLPWLMTIARSGNATFAHKGKTLTAREISTLIINSVGEARLVYSAVGLLGSSPDNFSHAIGTPASALVL